MALNIKDPEVDRLARELASRTGLSITKAVRKALDEQLKREGRKSDVSLAEELLEIGRRASRLPVYSTETEDEILGYDEDGIPYQ